MRHTGGMQVIESVHKTAEEVLAASVLKKNERGSVVVSLSGPLGAGKTTLTKHIAFILGVSERVSSPTFVLCKEYPLKGKPFDVLVHIDAYRIENKEETKTIRLDDILKKENTLVVVEWPEHIFSALPKEGVFVSVREDHNFYIIE